MNEEEKKAIVELKHYANITTHWKQEEFTDSEIDNYIKLTLNYISKLQKELEQEKEKNKKLNLENQALFESINCNDDNMLARRYSNLQKELDKKDKVIDLMAEYFCGNNWEFVYSTAKEVKEYFYKRVEEENE